MQFDFGGDVNSFDTGGFSFGVPTDFGGPPPAAPSFDYSPPALGLNAGAPESPGFTFSGDTFVKPAGEYSFGGDRSLSASDPGPVGSGAGGFGDVMRTVGGYADSAMPFLKLGLGGLSAYTGVQAMNQAKANNKIAQQAASRSAAAAAPAVSAAQELIPAGTKAMLGGSLPPGLEEEVQKFIRDNKTAARSRLAKLGITNSTMLDQVDKEIEADAVRLRENLAQQLVQTGTADVAAATGALGNSGTIAQQQGNTTTQAIQAANNAVNTLFGAGA